MRLVIFKGPVSHLLVGHLRIPLINPDYLSFPSELFLDQGRLWWVDLYKYYPPDKSKI